MLVRGQHQTSSEPKRFKRAYYPEESVSDAGGSHFDHYPEAPFPVILPSVALDRPREDLDPAATSVVGNYPAAGTWSLSLSRMTSGSTNHSIDRHRATNPPLT